MSSSCPEPALLSADTSVCACAADAVGYRGFVDLFIVISVGISSIVVLFRLVYRVKPGSAASEAAAQQVAMPRAASMRAIGSGASSNNVTGKRGSVKDRLENEIRSLLPRRSTYYAMPFFADTVANKQEFIDSLIELGDDALDGWLLVKRGVQRGKNWKKRYVVLDGNGRIKYYQNAEAARKNVNIKGSLTVHAVKPADPMEFGANTLEVRGTLGGTYFFRPEGEMAARKWLCVLTRRAIQGRVPGRIDADPSAALLAATNGEANGESSAITASGSGESATDPVLKSHKLEAFIEDMTYGKEASLRQFYVVVKFKSELHDHSSVPVGQTVPKPCEKSVINWQENLSWHFMDHPCVECEECKATGLSTGSFKGLPDIMVLHVYEIHLRYLTTKIGQVALSLKEVFGFTGMKEATMNCKWPIMSNTDTVLGQLGLKLQYSVELGGDAAAVPFLVTTDAERELLGEYEIHPAIKDCREFFDLFYSSPKTLARWQAYYKSRGDTELDIGEWSESSEYGGQVRVVGCRALTNASIGPASTMTSDTQHVFFADSADADPEKLVIESRVFMHDIPYGDCFTVEKVYTITRGPNGNLVAKCTLGIPFTKGCMFKSKIISATRESVTQATKLMYEELNKTMEGDGSVSMNVPAKPFLVSTEDERHFIGQYDIHPGIKDPMQFFELFYANGTGPKWTAFYKETGDTDHEITEWKQSLDHGGKIRTIKYRAQNTAPIGPPSSSATNDQHVKLPADEDDSLVLESKMELYDIPYGDCFTVETVYVVERSATSKNLVAKVYVGIPFTKSTMFKGKIVSGTRDGVTKTSVKVFGYIHKVMESEGAQADAGRGSEIDAGGRRSVTDEGRGSMPGRRVMMARVNSTLDGSVALEEIFENQRVSIFGKWGPNHLLPTDRSRFTNRNGDVELSFEQISLPPHWTWTSPWKIDKSYTECDEEGWSYATDFPRFKSHLARGKSSNKKLGASVRRRRWIRMMAYVPPEPVAPLAGVASSGTSPSASGANENSTTGALTAP